jgi:hypothetical protein
MDGRKQRKKPHCARLGNDHGRGSETLHEEPAEGDEISDEKVMEGEKTGGAIEADNR